jgi:hypothetical protein
MLFPFLPHSCAVHLDIIKVTYLPTCAQEFSFKIDIKICTKNAPTCFGLITKLPDDGY